MIIRMTEEQFDRHEREIAEINVGVEYAIVECCNVLEPSMVWYELIPDVDDGIGGNMNPAIKRWHGWRGTTNDISMTACGLHKVTRISGYKNGDYRISLGPDLKADEP